VRTIIVALDGSPFAEAAIPLALGVAQCLKARLEVVSVHQPPSGVRAISGAGVHDLSLDQRESVELRAALQHYLGHVASRIARSPDAPPVLVTLLEGEPADRLCEYAAEREAALLVVTTHGRGGVSRAWLGSVTDAVLRETTVPLLVLRPPASTTGAATTDSLVAQQVRKVLVALDGSSAGEAELEPLNALFGDAVDYVLFGAVPPLHPMLRAIASQEEYERDLLAQEAKFAGYLKTIETALTDRGLQASRCALVDLEPARAIHQCAASNAVDVIAMATHGRGLLGRVMLGSIADKVLRTADAPVLLCRIPPDVA
jgi:nucleotide-binding universal stress UspA family protein